MNRWEIINKNDGTKHIQVLLKPNRKLRLNDKEFHVLLDEEDFDKIKKYNWRVSIVAGKFTAITYIGDKPVIITKLMWPHLKKIHRVNKNSLDNRRSNIKHFINLNKKTKPVYINQPTLIEKKTEETKMLVVNESTYNAVKKIGKQHDITVDKAICLLLDDYKKEEKEPVICDCSGCNYQQPPNILQKLRKLVGLS